MRLSCIFFIVSVDKDGNNVLMNVDFVKDDYRFNARSSAIILNEKKDKILLFKVEDGRDYFLLPGGRIELYEDSLTAIKRETLEKIRI